MNTKQEFESMMKEQTEIALATMKGSAPNVRIVNFFYDDRDKKVYFLTFEDNDKVREISVSNEVSFTTVPKSGNAHVKIQGQAMPSKKAINDVKEGFINRIEGYGEMIEQAGEHLKLFEISFTKALVTLDFENAEVLLI